MHIHIYRTCLIPVTCFAYRFWCSLQPSPVGADHTFHNLPAAICRVQVTGAIFANFAAILVLCRPILEHVGAMLTHVGAENKQKQKVLIMQGYSGSISRTTSL